MKKLMDKPELKKWLSHLLLAIAIIVAYSFIISINSVVTSVTAFLEILSPFFAGFVLAYLMNMPCSMFQRLFEGRKNAFIRKHARGISILTVYILLALLVTALLGFLIPAIQRNMSSFVANLPEYKSNAQAYSLQLNTNFNIPMDFNAMFEFFSLKGVLDLLGIESIESSLDAVMSVSTYLLNAVLAIFASVYCLFETQSFGKFLKRLLAIFLSSSHFDVFMKYTAKTNDYFKKFVMCQMVDAFVVGVAATIGLVVMGCQYAFVLGPLLGLLNLIPCFGPIVGTVILFAVVAVSDGIGLAFVALLFVIILQQLDGQILQPKILGGALSISPLLVIIGITVGGAFWGVMGMVVAIPVITVMKTILLDIIEHAELVKKQRILEIDTATASDR